MGIARVSPPASPRPSKRIKVDCSSTDSTLQCTSHLNFRDAVVLAPMVRSGSLPTRLFALKYGAALVWAPEIIDKAILHSARTVNQATGVVSYEIEGRAIFSTHPVEMPHLIYQIGSADPALALAAAQHVAQDVSGVDLNCGCPKHFSTHAGMGAALLTAPDTLCAILRALRGGLPPRVAVSAKIRLLPTQEATKELVRRIVECGVSALTIHCRTRNMRPRERALLDRLREIVDFVRALPGGGIPVIANGDCASFADAVRVRDLTGADSVMIATAAESNPTCFSPSPLTDLEMTFIPQYIRLAHYLNNHFANTKHCVVQFKASGGTLGKADRVRLRGAIAQAKSYDDWAELVANDWDGRQEMEAIENAIRARGLAAFMDDVLETPVGRANPEGGLICGAPGAQFGMRFLPANVLGRDATTPSPSGPQMRRVAGILI